MDEIKSLSQQAEDEALHGDWVISQQSTHKGKGVREKVNVLSL